MTFLIRKPNLDMLAARGIPRDFIDIRDYFNRGIRENKLHYIPRKNQITDDEISSLWIPNLDKNICLVAEDQRRSLVVGCIVYFENTLSTNYEQAAQRRVGEIAGTTDPQYYLEETIQINKGMLASLIEELRTQKKKGFFV